MVRGFAAVGLGADLDDCPFLETLGGPGIFDEGHVFGEVAGVGNVS